MSLQFNRQFNVRVKQKLGHNCKVKWKWNIIFSLFFIRPSRPTDCVCWRSWPAYGVFTAVQMHMSLSAFVCVAKRPLSASLQMLRKEILGASQQWSWCNEKACRLLFDSQNRRKWRLSGMQLNVLHVGGTVYSVDMEDSVNCGYCLFTCTFWNMQSTIQCFIKISIRQNLHISKNRNVFTNDTVNLLTTFHLVLTSSFCCVTQYCG